MSNINERIRTLINDNKELLRQKEFKNLPDENILVYDGVIGDSDECKFLFLLKEANSKDLIAKHKDEINKIDDTWSLAESAYADYQEQKDKKPIHWQELCYWIEAFKDSSKRFEYSNKNCGSNLNGIAIVNIKKVAGQPKSDAYYLNNIVNNSIYRKLICNEIELISPEIVVCGGTYNYAKVLYPEGETNEVVLGCGYKYFTVKLGNKNVYFLEYIHPSQQGAARKYALQFALAKEVFGELKEVIGKS